GPPAPLFRGRAAAADQRGQLRRGADPRRERDRETGRGRGPLGVLRDDVGLRAPRAGRGRVFRVGRTGGPPGARERRVRMRAVRRPCRMLLLAPLLAAMAGCGAYREPQRFLARKAVLERQVEDLRRLVRAAEEGGLFPRDKLVVGVSEPLANELARLALPREQVVGGRYRVRLERAEVRFRDEHGAVRFHGKVGPSAPGGSGGPAERAEPAFFADLALFGVVDTVDVDRATGVLR